jgi:hypothetical protein
VASCAAATPYLNWDITVGAPVQSILVHVLDANGTEVLRLHTTSGSVLWPGWTRVDDRMTLDNPAVATLHLYADINLGGAVSAQGLALSDAVVTTGQVSVNFPAADTQCVAPGATQPSVLPTQVVPGAAGPAAQNLAAAPAELPETGFPAKEAALAGAVLILIGLALVARARAAQSPAA